MESEGSVVVRSLRGAARGEVIDKLSGWKLKDIVTEKRSSGFVDIVKGIYYNYVD